MFDREEDLERQITGFEELLYKNGAWHPETLEIIYLRLDALNTPLFRSQDTEVLNVTVLHYVCIARWAVLYFQYRSPELGKERNEFYRRICDEMYIFQRRIPSGLMAESKRGLDVAIGSILQTVARLLDLP